MKLPVYDNKLEYLGMVDRDIVHKTGLWHRTVQLNIFKGDRLLIQCRSNKVDIAKGQLDQSLATHLLKGETEIDAIQRGLREELGITDIKMVEMVARNVKIIKRYKYDKKLYNREFVTLYRAEYDRLPTKLCKKIRWAAYIPVKNVYKDVIKNPDSYTQTFIMWMKNKIW